MIFSYYTPKEHTIVIQNGHQMHLKRDLDVYQLWLSITITIVANLKNAATIIVYTILV